jgi:ferritin-like protein
MTRVNNLAVLAKKMRLEGNDSETIARTLHKKRRELGKLFKNLTNKKTRANIFARNLKKYGDKWGPTMAYLREKGKSWEDIISSASRANSSLEALLKIL